MQMLTDAPFWLALGQVMVINLVLSADNAVVIALAARALPGRSHWQALALGAAAVVLARIVLTLLAAYILQWPMLKIVGGLLLLWIAVRLLAQPNDGGEVAQAHSRWRAVQIIVTADMVMSLDNVLSVAAAAQDQWAALVAGLAASIPLVVYFAAMLSRAMQRWPVIVAVGAGLIGWVAGGLLISDPLWTSWIDTHAPWVHGRIYDWRMSWAQLLGAVLVIVLGRYLARRTAC